MSKVKFIFKDRESIILRVRVQLTNHNLRAKGYGNHTSMTFNFNKIRLLHLKKLLASHPLNWDMCML